MNMPNVRAVGIIRVAALRRLWQKTCGLTLVEVLVVSATFLVLIGGISLVLASSGQRVWNRTDAQLVSITQVQQGLNRLSEDLHRASQTGLVCNPANPPPPSLSFCVNGACPGGTRVTYQCTSCNAAGQGTLLRTEGANPARIVATRISAFTPSCQAGGVVQIVLSTQGTTPQGVGSQSVQTQIFVQNP